MWCRGGEPGAQEALARQSSTVWCRCACHFASTRGLGFCPFLTPRHRPCIRWLDADAGPTDSRRAAPRQQQQTRAGGAAGARADFDHDTQPGGADQAEGRRLRGVREGRGEGAVRPERVMVLSRSCAHRFPPRMEFLSTSCVDFCSRIHTRQQKSKHDVETDTTPGGNRRVQERRNRCRAERGRRLATEMPSPGCRFEPCSRCLSRCAQSLQRSEEGVAMPLSCGSSGVALNRVCGALTGTSRAFSPKCARR